MIGILHGYLLDGSGSNLWTQSVVRAVCRAGGTVHLVCQEPHPERFDFIARAVRYDAQHRPVELFERTVPFPGACTLHKPDLGGLLPVYVGDRYEEHPRVVPMVDLDDASIEDHLARNVAVVDRIVAEYGVDVLLANHAVLMSVVARRVAQARAIRFAVMPHGSAIEYAVRRDARFHRMASGALRRASTVFVIGPELRQRIRTVFPRLTRIERRIVNLPLGVDAEGFAPVAPADRAAGIRRLESELREEESGRRPPPEILIRPDADCIAKLRRVDWPGDRLILFVGRLIPAKGIHALVAAMPAILRHEPAARLIIVGHGPLRERLEELLRSLQDGDRDRVLEIVSEPDRDGRPGSEPLDHARRYFDLLEARGELDSCMKTARECRLMERVIFTGYLAHRQLRHLFPCCDVAVIPSVVAEAGPLVFLEAIASGAFPIGTNFAGIAASIDAVSETVPREVADVMRLRREPEHLAADIVSSVGRAFRIGRTHLEALRRRVVDRNDWSIVARTLVETLERLPGKR